MPLTIATHNGSFHADDVLAVALLRAFVDPKASVTRTRDPALLDQADVVVDVGAVFDPGTRRFDHHQASYQGPLSSAGMVLRWLDERGHVDAALARFLDDSVVTYVDDVDNGRREPTAGVPCFATMVAAANRGAETLAEFDAHFERAVAMAMVLVDGLRAEHAELVEARDVVRQAMEHAEQTDSNAMRLSRYVRWKPPYFAMGGADHPTDFVILPGLDGSWRVVCIPPREGSFAQKTPLPESWAGLTDDALVEACGVPGARFCHKNRFIAVFDTESHLRQALTEAGLLR